MNEPGDRAEGQARSPVFEFAAVVLFCAAIVAISVVLLRRHHRSEIIPDDAMLAGKTIADFPQANMHAFDEMDSGIALNDDETRGRNTWLLWTAGDQVFWDHMAQRGFGIVDLLKTLDSRHRATRFADMGLMNEPGYAPATQPDQYGLWLDQGAQEEGVDARVYGRSSGVIGLRIYPNRKFDAAAQRAWDPQRYYNDAPYYTNPQLVRPYIVGISCALCHVAFNPLKPPDDPEQPKWQNLSSTIGNQYLVGAKVFAATASADSYAFQVLHSWKPGTIDTSFLATDNLNNPSKINSIYAIKDRLSVAHTEEISGGALYFSNGATSAAVPHVLKDGADSVGLACALSRVYVSIGEYSQEWLRDHNVIVGGSAQHPFAVEKAQKGSIYWQSTIERIPSLSRFLMRMKSPHLADAPGGREFITRDAKLLEQGKIVFAEHCARCHSSKQPPASIDRSSSEYTRWMKAEVLKADFLDENFLSTEERIPVSVVQTNAARGLATNAVEGHVWDNFSSRTYKSLPSVGEIEVTNPFDQSTSSFSLPAGGPGYYRVPSLLGIWATAPLLHNSALGTYTDDPSTAGRVAAFEDAMEKLLWPEKRRGVNSILRTSEQSYIEIAAAYLPKEISEFVSNGYLRVGPIPENTPINLLANADLDLSNPHGEIDRLNLLARVQGELLRIKVEKLNAEEAQKALLKLVPDLLKISKCPDFIEDRGHYFGTNLSDADKRALIEFMKTF
ncbi:hypothetical protein H7849_13375 [Alloacidobacterium dinghuense]|uniref:Cytochrome c domain-containing protein n=1 Tax=Alloacidobacterium dinghuense TaxID=2763107 RepID=A0A7G8BCB5_9BACT|nr:hypothetical protein [Alloacidobacterium dinghuense]QNI30185.1 hypothetical protein H7849_13375 [Alloacidobacterium dinghuense]